MPRLPRLHVPGGYYHVILRGNHREDLFAMASDRYELNSIVAQVLEKYEARSCVLLDVQLSVSNSARASRAIGDDALVASSILLIAMGMAVI